VISVIELTKLFPHAGHDVLAVEHVSFRVSRGEVYGLLGENGAGKTTTLRMILGLLQPTSGFAEVDGHRSTHAPDAVKSRIGLAERRALPMADAARCCCFSDLYNVSPARAERSLSSSRAVWDSRVLDRRCVISTGQKRRVNRRGRSLRSASDLSTNRRGAWTWWEQGDFRLHRGAGRGQGGDRRTHRLDEAQWMRPLWLCIAAG
jgi:ABC-type Na+ transport system ATPase subunit NatA